MGLRDFGARLRGYIKLNKGVNKEEDEAEERNRKLEEERAVRERLRDEKLKEYLANLRGPVPDK